MSADNGVDWLTCGEAECIGRRLNAGGRCLAHANDQDLDAELKRLGDEGTIDARGVTISAVLLDRILAAAPRDEQQADRPRFDEVRFDRATFGDQAKFHGASFGDEASFADANFGVWASFADATFGDRARFHGVTFGDKAWFARATFGDQAWFAGATFGDQAYFAGATFGDQAWFAGATFGGRAWFARATFRDRASFDAATFRDRAIFDAATFGDRASFGGATFSGRAWFARATFRDRAWFGDASFGDETRFGHANFGLWASFDAATFGDEAWFGDTTFGDRVWFGGATFGDEAFFGGATFGDWARFGPLLGRGQLALSPAVFGRGSQLAISADRLDCRGMRLPDGGVLNLRWVEIQLDLADISRPTVLAGVGPFPRLDEGSLQPRVARSWRSERPRILSLRGSDVRNLVLSNVDLRACRFSGAHNLDQLRLEATTLFADRPSGWRTGWAVPPVWRWTRRRTLAEEQRWRRAQPKHAGWYPRPCRVRGLAEQEGELRPAALALLYRALRKGRENAKDEPGAADFYYGEMEMRRHDQTAPPRSGWCCGCTGWSPATPCAPPERWAACSCCLPWPPSCSP
jgi:Pentapeptide repeats (9 copies)